MSAVRFILLATFLAGAATAHVGSPDVFFKGNAGPYPLLISIRPPDVVPGVAHVEIRSLGEGVTAIQLTPTPMTGVAAQHPPAPDETRASSSDTRSFEGTLWLMTPGSWEVRLHIAGNRGLANIAVPVPAIALKMQPMSQGVTWFLGFMLVFLTTGLIAITGAAVREAELPPGAASRWSARPIRWMAVASLIIGAALWVGWSWWGSQATNYSARIYKPLNASALLANDRLDLRIEDPGWLPLRKLDDLIPDHGHMMHLFLIEWPSMNHFFHLHPEQTAPEFFTLAPPALPAGNYRMFADIVHENGLAETAIGNVSLPDIAGAPLGDDDAGGSINPPPVNVIWNNRPAAIRPNQVSLYSFSLLDAAGQPANDLEPYMGMGGHAEFLKEDGSVFAHVHPSGSVSMASLSVASPDAIRAMHQNAIGSEVTFPYGVPSPGNYRVFVQLKRQGHVETGAFRFTVR